MKILIVDDELVSRKTIERLLQSLGHETVVAKDGMEALEIWEDQRNRMVITDWMMPEMNGVDLCRRIRATEGSQYTYLIMVTSRNGLDDIVTGMDAGADDFIAKPFAKGELAARVRAGERILSFETRDLVIFSMAKLAESRDPETGGHLDRMRHYSKALAEAISKSDDSPPEVDNLFVDNILLTSPLHDIGKIGIPDYVLLKPGRFDDKEFAIMKNHCRIGFETLSGALREYPKADYLSMSAEIALSHHEQYNGTGYPCGLKGNDIPLSARIVALADVYDALVSKRVYKDAYGHDMAKDIILKEREAHFDPMVVDAFLSCEDRFIEIFERFAEG